MKLNTKILIVGGGGYVGSMLVPYLIEKGYQVGVIDLFIYGEKTIDNHKNYKKIKGDIRDYKFLKDHIDNYDVIIHLACISNDPSFELNPSLGKSINFDSFEPLVDLSKKRNVKKFIFASSSSVYGIKEKNNVIETDSTNPITDYSKFKLNCEKILLNYKSENFCPFIVRPATVCGYSRRQRLDLIVNILTNYAFHKKVINIFGGDQLRPNIHIKDMIRVYEFFIKEDIDKMSGEVVNAGIENNSVNDLAEIVKKRINNEIEIKKVPTDDNRSYHISSKKLVKEYNFKFNYTISDAVDDLKYAFDSSKLVNTFKDDKFFNVKLMQKINLI